MAFKTKIVPEGTKCTKPQPLPRHERPHPSATMQAMETPSPASEQSISDCSPKLTSDQVVQIFFLRPKRSAADQTFVPSTRFCRELCRRF
eukprot:3686882-Rhodomonas_salina.1